MVHDVLEEVVAQLDSKILEITALLLHPVAFEPEDMHLGHVCNAPFYPVVTGVVRQHFLERQGAPGNKVPNFLISLISLSTYQRQIAAHSVVFCSVPTGLPYDKFFLPGPGSDVEMRRISLWAVCASLTIRLLLFRLRRRKQCRSL